MRKTLRYGMVGGDLNAFIGGVHRIAVNFDGRAQLVAGCFNPDMAANKECGQFYAWMRIGSTQIIKRWLRRRARERRRYRLRVHRNAELPPLPGSEGVLKPRHQRALRKAVKL